MKKTVRTIISIFFLVILALSIIGCGGESKPEKKIPFDNDKIKVNFVENQYENGKMNLTVYIKNKSPYMFSGDVKVEMTGYLAMKIGEDTFKVRDLAPGEKEGFVLNVKPYVKEPKVYHFSANGTFTETNIKASPENVVDGKNETPSLEVDKKLTSYINRKFKNTFSRQYWFNDIKSVTIYNKYNAVVLLKDGYQLKGDDYAFCIGFNYNFHNTVAVNSKGNIVGHYFLPKK